ncbi:hypothetical protein QC762_0031470 [Podospora pseudocomata]|uniref:Uncharacterized protein n=1 Tax=Podospora pseudocomata TaxID=2093779 RepID=A0ABR0GQ21_9PEZI|nr:hypothetical protein QC762_0031470 [Podospora pseudocomata]
MRDDGLESKRKGLRCFVREIRYDDRKVVDKTEEKPRSTTLLNMKKRSPPQNGSHDDSAALNKLPMIIG